jgi:hypothetical protein
VKTTNPLEVHHLPHGCLHDALEYTDGNLGKSYFLPFCGKVQRGNTSPRAYLVSLPDDIKKSQLYPGRLYKIGVAWVLGFSGLPATANLAIPEPYVFVTCENDAHVAPHMAVGLRIQVRTRPRANWPHLIRGDLEIMAPTSGTILCSAGFNACGSAKAGVTNIKGVMQGLASFAAGDALIPLGTDDQNTDLWVLPFGHVDEGDGYTLKVTGTGTTDAPTMTGLAVRDSACVAVGPAAPPPPIPPPAAP